MSEQSTIDMASGQAPPIEFAILIAPGYNPIDIIGPHTLLGSMPGVNLHLVWKDANEVMGVPTFPTRPTTTFRDCPEDVDILYVGAPGIETFKDAETLEFIADRGGRARWVAGSCVGSLLLGAAGLLQGYRATTNYAAVHMLSHFGAIHAPGNVVEDRNRITAGPATGGFEIAFRIIQDIYGDEAAKEAILQTEYAPKPLFDVGSPELAGPELTALATSHLEPSLVPLYEIVKNLGARLHAQA